MTGLASDKLVREAPPGTAAADTEGIRPVAAPGRTTPLAIPGHRAPHRSAPGSRSAAPGAGGRMLPKGLVPKAMLAAADVASLVAGLWLAYHLRPHIPGADAVTGGADYGLIAVLGVPLWVGVMVRYRLYSARHVQPVAGELTRLMHAGAAGIAAMALAAFMLEVDVSRGWLGLSFLLGTGLLILERAVARSVFERLRASGRLTRRVLVVGADEHAVALATSLTTRARLGYKVLGFVDDGVEPWPSVAGGPPILGTVDEVRGLLASTGADGVIVSTTALTPFRVNAVARSLADAGVHVELSSPLRGIAAERLTVRSLGDQYTVVHVRPRPQSRWRATGKRTFDVVVASVGLALSAPLLLILAVAIRLDSPGPAFFLQSRVGRGGVPFRLLKLRSMVVDAEDRLDALRHLNEAEGPLFKVRDDPRITRVGRVIRATSFDELPQLWNVLRGEMSMVGPRPALPSEISGWTPELHQRLKVRPGITGMWQVSGRADATFDDYVHLDLYYVDNWSLPLDIRILLRTVPSVLCQRGAR